MLQSQPNPEQHDTALHQQRSMLHIMARIMNMHSQAWSYSLNHICRQKSQMFTGAVRSTVVPTLTVKIASKMHVSALQCMTQPNTTLLDCTLYLTQDLYDQAF